MNRLRHPQKRPGAVLILVLVVVMLLSFSLYSFSERMLLQYQATSASLNHMQLRNHAESGIAAVGDLLMHPQAAERSADAKKLQALNHISMSAARERFAGFSVLRTLPQPGESPQFGITDEAARLNLNSLPLDPDRRKQTRERLMQLPQMTTATAAAILDWMDADDDVSQFGAESQWYLAQQPGYRPRQGRFASLRELLLVRGVTSELLYGEDANRNGIADFGEDANRDGRVDLGWSQWLTVNAYERLTQWDGRPLTNLNGPNLATLFDTVEAEFGTEAATFVLALRLRGPLQGEAEILEAPTEDEKIDERFATAQRRLAQQLGIGSQSAGPNSATGLEAMKRSGGIRTETRAGISFTGGGTYTLGSVTDLIGVRVRITIENEDVILTSPWNALSGDLQEAIGKLQQDFCCFAGQRIPARVNLFEADREVLMTVPEITESIATSIVAGRNNRSQSGPWDNDRNLGWFVERGILTLEQLRKIGPYVTDQGDVFSGVAIGHSEGTPAGIAIRFTVDTSGKQHSILEWNELPPIAVSQFLTSEQRQQ